MTPEHIPFATFGSILSCMHQYSWVWISIRNLKFLASPIPKILGSEFLQMVHVAMNTPIRSSDENRTELQLTLIFERTELELQCRKDEKNPNRTLVAIEPEQNRTQAMKVLSFL